MEMVSKRMNLTAAMLAISALGVDYQKCPESQESHDMRGTPVGFKAHGPQIGRNDPCPCGSGKKFKKCCKATDKVEIPRFTENQGDTNSATRYANAQ